MNFTNSKILYKEAIEHLPGGVNSPVRAFNSVDMTPIFVKSARGAIIKDVDDNEYIDYVCSFGPLILGHASEVATKGLQEALSNGTTFGMPTNIEITMAKELKNAYKSIELVRMVSSGTEATMSAIRLARGYTKKNKIIKFEGCYHGHSDGLLVKAGSGPLTQGVPTSSGVLKSTTDETLISEFNNIEHVEMLFEKYKEDIACIIVEPIPGNMGLITAQGEFLKKLRELCTRFESLLIFDEVISGFRVAYGGAASLYNVEPDLVCLGKIIGGGLPVGAYGGKKDIMKNIAPLGEVYQAGTLSGNPIAMKMGLNVLNYLKENQFIYKELEEKADKLEKGFKNNLEKLEIKDITINKFKGMICQFFVKDKVESFSDVIKADTKKYAIYFKEMLENGILLPPSQFECMFLSTQHSDEIIEKTIKAHYLSMEKVKEYEKGR